MNQFYLAAIALASIVCLARSATAFPPPRTLTALQVMKQIEYTSPRMARAKAELAEVKAMYTGARALPNPELFLSEERLEYPAGDETERTIGISQDISYLWKAPQEIGSRSAMYGAEQARYAEELTKAQCEVLIGLQRFEFLDIQLALVDSISESVNNIMR